MRHRFILSFVVLVSTFGCTRDRGALGSTENPVKMFFVPSVDVRLLEDTSSKLKTYLEAHTPYHFKIAIPPSYVAVIEAFGTDRADVASINPYGYVLARDKYGVEARLVTERFGETTYKSQILARSDSGIKRLEDLKDKRLAFVDPASLSGYLLPMKYLRDRGIRPKATTFAMRHDNVISMIYQGQVDAGATFYSPPERGEIQDARRLVRAQYPDIEKKVKIVTLTSPIPNDPIIFRKDLPEDMKVKIADAMIDFAKTPIGRETLLKLSSITGMVRCTDRDFDTTREMVKSLGAVETSK